MASLLTRVSPVLDGVPLVVGDGISRVRAIRVESGYTPPVYLCADSNVRRVYRVDALPADLVVALGRVSILSADPGVSPAGTQRYVAASGGIASGLGTFEAPWTLAHAVAGAGGVLQPGDTVWLRGGTYVGTFLPTGPHATAAARITFRQFGGDAPLGERVRIDGQWQHRRDYWDLRGVEVFQTDPVVTGIEGIVLGEAAGSAYGARVINCIVHDCGATGCTGWLNSRGPSLYYGMIVYNNGTHHNLDHGFYIHDQEKVLENCIAFNNLARNFQSYDSLRPHKSIHHRRCIAFGAGELSVVNGGSTNFLSRIIGSQSQEDVLFEQCVGFHKLANATQCQQLRLGTNGNGLLQKDATVRGCYFWRGRTFMEIAQWQRLAVEDNTFVNDATASDHIIMRDKGARDFASWERNAWYMDPASVKWNYKLRRNFAGWKSAVALGATDTISALTPPTRAFVFPNDFEPGRAHVAIFNHELASVVPVDLATVLVPGQHYEVRSVQDLWGTPVTSGTYTGGLVSIPMSAAVPPPTPGGAGRVFSTPPTTGPEFDAFLVLAVP